MTNKVYPTVILLILYQSVFSQTKTYSGEYEDGVATYQYVENSDLERILNGSFTYKTVKYREGRGQCTIEVTGRFKSNIKDGKWTYKVTDPDKEGTTETVSGSYVNGKMNGGWTLKNIQQNNSKVIRSSNVTFNNGVLVGSFSYNFNVYFLIDEYSFVSIKGKFTKEGVYDSTWLIKYKNAEGKSNEDVRKYKDGRLYWRLHRDITTGEIIDRYDTIKYRTEPTFKSWDYSYLPDKVIEVWLNQDVTGNDNVYDSPILCNLFNGGNNYLNESMPNKALFVSELKRKEDEKASALYKEKELMRIQAIEEKEKADKEKKVKEAEERRRIEKEAEEIRKSESTDYGQIRKAVKTEFLKWLQKGEFESSEEYQNRIKTKYVEELNNISEKNFLSSKSQKIRSCYGILGNYDGERFSLSTYSRSSGNKEKIDWIINIHIKKELAPSFKGKFSGAYDEETQIFITPQDYILIYNKWIPSSVIIVFNSKFVDEAWIRSGLPISKLPNGKIVSSTRYTTPELNNYKLINIKESTSIGDDLYFYEWNIKEENFYKDSSVQTQRFTISDLGIELPFK